MNLTSTAARHLSQRARLQQRQLIRDTANQMRREMGEKPVNFGWLRFAARLRARWL